MLTKIAFAKLKDVNILTLRFSLQFTVLAQSSNNYLYNMRCRSHMLKDNSRSLERLYALIITAARLHTEYIALLFFIN